ncbi:MAG TPA: ABC transporter ATP-binding protein [Candidatus Fimimorpha faecalis]|uniref:ABC transporter ATP-binding protein n=1 Tax=Candidatus Fimimorpha faecalis TaxID=2840824 RepID=A0A9D1EE62_9FIRM|nr:ABC transporter ATP-binding protein [Candidatus Fimimorpha faecalis]
MKNIILETIGLSKVYMQGDVKVTALDQVNIKIYANEITAVVGPSGCGKSTLLHLLSGMDRPTSGKVLLDGEDIYSLNDRMLTKLRSEVIGFIFQKFNLLPDLTVIENITLPADLSNIKYDREYLNYIIETLGLDERLDFFPRQLSGGQQQRVAIARALIKKPKIIFADEPTGNLDTKSGERFIEIMLDANKKLNLTFVIVTHNPDLALKSNRILSLQDGKVIDDKVV